MLVAGQCCRAVFAPWSPASCLGRVLLFKVCVVLLLLLLMPLAVVMLLYMPLSAALPVLLALLQRLYKYLLCLCFELVLWLAVPHHAGQGPLFLVEAFVPEARVVRVLLLLMGGD